MRQLTPRGVAVSSVEGARERFFTPETDPRLEEFMAGFIRRFAGCFPTPEARGLMRETFLYGFLVASGREFEYAGMAFNGEREVCGPFRPRMALPEHGAVFAGDFYTNNGVLAVGDVRSGKIWIRGGDSYHGYFSGDERRPLGVEGTLLQSGYVNSSVFVPHSNSDVYVDGRLEELFRAMRGFSREVRGIRGDLPKGGLWIRDFSEEELPAPYPVRDPRLPRIELADLLLIPGNPHLPPVRVEPARPKLGGAEQP